MLQQTILPDPSSWISLKRSENYIFVLLQAPWFIAVIHKMAEVHPAKAVPKLLIS